MRWWPLESSPSTLIIRWLWKILEIRGNAIFSVIYLKVLRFDLKNTETHENTCDFLPAISFLPAVSVWQSAVCNYSMWGMPLPSVLEWGEALSLGKSQLMQKPSLLVPMCLIVYHKLTVCYQKAAWNFAFVILGRTFIPHKELFFLSQTAKFSAELSKRSFKRPCSCTFL